MNSSRDIKTLLDVLVNRAALFFENVKLILFLFQSSIILDLMFLIINNYLHQPYSVFKAVDTPNLIHQKSFMDFKTTGS